MGKKKKRRILKPEEKKFRQTQRRFRKQLNSVFSLSGFTGIPTRGQTINFRGKDGELDGIFVYANVVVIMEETCSKTSDQIHSHLLKKAQFYKLVQDHQEEFIENLSSIFPKFKLSKGVHQASGIKLIIAYCTKNKLDETHKANFPNILIMEDRQIQYFLALGRTLQTSARFELFKFFKLNTTDVDLTAGENDLIYNGFLLPETPSGFPSGHKIITFYIDPERLLHLSYVLRKDGWEESDNLYQRMISKSKIKSMRRFLAQEDKVFINNIIVSLPSTTKVLDAKDNRQVSPATIIKTTPIKIQIPNQFNTVGIIDGQHRVFAYHEGDDSYERQIAQKRKMQQLLVTGLIYPSETTEEKQREFEARLFLEINDKQTKTRADLRQIIEAIVNPFSITAIARSVISRLAANGPLCGYLEEHQFDRGKLKSSSIVSYGLRHIVKCDGSETLFALWKHPSKNVLATAIKAASIGNKNFKKPPKKVLDDYVNFCASEIRNVLIGYKASVTHLSKDLWTLDRKTSRALSATAVNGVVFCLRKVLLTKKTTDMNGYIKAFSKLKINFTPANFKYRSSHWSELGEEMFKQCFF